MVLTRRRLADGREILYFDREPTSRDTVDIRDLPHATSQSQARFDPLVRQWVVLASHRQTRAFLPPVDQCPLCPSTDERRTEIPECDYDVVVFENRFPAMSTVAPDSSVHTAVGSPVTGLRNGFGRCEVVCFTSNHNATFAQLDSERARLVVDVWAARSAELAGIDGVAQVFCFENHGEEIGVTLSHPHGQIYAYPFVAPRVSAIMRSLSEHRKSHSTNLFRDVLHTEQQAGVRVVAANDEWTAFVPPFARWPYEVQFYPNRHVCDIPDLDDSARDGFVEVYLGVLGRFARRFDTPMPYVAAWNQAPTVATGLPREQWWLHLDLFSIRRAADKLKYLAGSESGMGVFISDTTPEKVAAELREA